MNIYSYLRNLINAKFYTSKEEAELKVDVFFASNKFDEQKYTELTLLIAEKYAA